MLEDRFLCDDDDRDYADEDTGASFDSMKSRCLELCCAHGESDGEMLGDGCWEWLRLMVNLEVGEVE